MKISRSRKALSPVIATIILIAVTVAVSIAVAAWMGALTFSFMGTEQIKITNVQFTNATGTLGISVTFMNTGTSPVTLVSINVNNNANAPWTGSQTLAANSNATVPFGYQWNNGYQYEIEARSTKGNEFTYTATAPS
jgi:flagellin-like protein